MTTVYIGLGSNLGDRHSYIQTALKMLDETGQVEVVRISDIIETAPLGDHLAESLGQSQPKYLNAVAQIRTNLTPQDLHEKLLDIEMRLGRVRRGEPPRGVPKKWAPRIIDLDLLLFDQEIVNHPNLTIPHPQMHLRSFVLSGLCQLNPHLLHPVIKEPVNELANRLNGENYVGNPNLPQLVSIAGIIGVGKTTLTEKLSKALNCKAIFESYDTNPFLPDVYAGKKELALDSQLYFLTTRANQLNHNTLAPGQIVLADYIFAKEQIYARQLLNEQQLALYQRIYPSFADRATIPVLVIYLQDSLENCLQRIRHRNRPYEQVIKKQFLNALDCGYKQLFTDWKTCPVIRLSMSKFDCHKNTNIEHLANQIKYYAAIGKRKM